LQLQIKKETAHGRWAILQFKLRFAVWVSLRMRRKKGKKREGKEKKKEERKEGRKKETETKFRPKIANYKNKTK
jgi:hypothetical protein